MLESVLSFYTEGHKPLRNHTQRSAYLTLCGNFIIKDSKDEYAIYDEAVYKKSLSP